MKYKLLKQIEEKDSIKVWSIFDIWDHRTTLDIDIPECQVPISFLISQWYIEEVKENKTIYDLKFWDHYWTLSNRNNISHNHCWMSQSFFETDVFCTFVTEREAKRNKLLKELATRTDRWLPSNWDEYFVIEWWAMYQSIWNDDRADKFRYNLWFIFRNWDEYNKYMTEENKDLLFKL